MKKYVTVYDIAKEAKVSPATVSRVLTGNAHVSEEKRVIIEEVIKKYNFQPNALARSLFNKQSKMIGVILTDITNPFFSTVFFETEKCALEAGYTMILCDSMNNTELESIHLRTLSEKQVDAIVFMGGRVNETKTNAKYAEEMNQVNQRIPIVIINGKMSGVDCYKVVVDEEKGITKLVEYLVELGHKKIGILGGIKGVTSSDIKEKAFIKAMNENGIDINKNWIISKGFSIEEGAYCMRQLLKQKEIPTAVLCMNDTVAIGAIKAAKAAKLKVPGDISITGFDDSYISEIINPQLTTINQNFKLIGKAVIDTIVDITNNKESQKEKVIDIEFVERNSCHKFKQK